MHCNDRDAIHCAKNVTEALEPVIDGLLEGCSVKIQKRTKSNFDL